MTMRRRLRVLHLPSTVGGNPQQLARAERELGLDSSTWTEKQNVYAYPADRVIITGDGLGAELRRWSAAIQALGYDVLHYNCGRSLMPERTPYEMSNRPLVRRLMNALYAPWAEMLDARVAHRLRIPIFVTYQGDDARQGDVCRRDMPIHFVHEVGDSYYTPTGDRWKRERIAAFDRIADGIFAVNPDLLRVLPTRAEFVPYANVDPRRLVAAARGPLPADPLVIHAPSHRGVKGTRHLLAAVERLRSEGVPFRFQLIEGLGNAEALKLYAQADLLVDQLLAGWYGGLAVEAMALSLPVVAYLRHEDFGVLPPGMRAELPVVDAHPGTIHQVLRDLLTTRRHELRPLGERGRRYVERWHDPRRIAVMLAQRYASAIAARAARRCAGAP